MGFPRVAIQTDDFSVSAEIAALRADDGRVGAVCTFVGTVRDRNLGQAAGSVSAMELEATITTPIEASATAAPSSHLS